MWSALGAILWLIGEEVKLMPLVSRLIAIVSIGALFSPASAQDRGKSSPPTIVTKTLVSSQAQKECFSLNNRQRLYYKFRADGPLNFKLSHQDGKEVVDIRRNGANSAAGSFAPRKTADHCLVWTNTGKQSVTLRYEFRRSSQ